MAESENKTIENTGAVENTESGTNKQYTQEEVDKLLQAECDRRVNQALEKAKKKNAEAIKEAEKLAKMSETERYEHELEMREKAIAQKEAELALSENKNAASKILAEKGISLNLVEFVVAEDADEMSRRIKVLERAFKDSVRLEVEKRLGSGAPKTNNNAPAELTKETFAKLSLAEKQNLYNTDRALYDELTK